jgi:hypothetical protein
VDTVTSVDEGPSQLTQEINRVLERLQELQNAKDQQGQDFTNHLNKIERELLDLSLFLRDR